jgi:hypothetical protein
VFILLCDIVAVFCRQQRQEDEEFRYDDCVAWSVTQDYPDGMPWMVTRIVNFAERSCDDTETYPEGSRGCGPRGDAVSSNGCINARDHDYASDACAADGSRLCSQEEVEAGCAADSACGYNGDYVWTSTPCELPRMQVCPRFNWIPFVDNEDREDINPDQCDAGRDWSWMGRPCKVQAQISAEGMLAVVHGGDRDLSGAATFSDIPHEDFAAINHDGVRQGSPNLPRLP